MTRRDGFTLVELVVVIAIVGLLTAFLGFRTGAFSFWKEESTIRELVELARFLHTQATNDQAFYQLEIDIQENTYRVGVLRPESDISTIGAQSSGMDVGPLTLELNDFRNPSMGDTQTLIAPPSFPSLFEPRPLPDGMVFEEVKTTRRIATRNDTDAARIVFSPKGFVEFAVIHLRTANGAPITIFINPYSGEAEIYREFKDFEWSGPKR